MARRGILIFLNVTIIVIMAIYVILIQGIKNDVYPKEVVWFMSDAVLRLMDGVALFFILSVILSFRHKQYIGLAIISFLFLLLLLINDCIFNPIGP